ncbi:MAG: hypothetical protein IPM71_13100 [Bacteroidota bacterium]|nr:MAG: hypothetical protein IPM71_13100 [Bacteroidota bacterium]
MKQNPHDQILEIRTMMERSSRFISLSGISGILAGTIALSGAALAFFYLNYDRRYFEAQEYFSASSPITSQKIWFLTTTALVVLILAIGQAIVLTTRKARKQGIKIWSFATRQMLISLMVPLLAGGIFCLALLLHSIVYLVAPAMLIFYGLALIQASRHTLGEIRWLGYSELSLGLLATLIPGYGLLAWAFGFGILHIVYGWIMYQRYDKQ